MVNQEKYFEIVKELKQKKVTLVAVSKTKPVEAIMALYALGHRDFGENYVQELLDKQAQLPPDIRWHFIGHLQTNKVKYLVPFVHLIHGVDSFKLVQEISKQGKKIGRKISALLQVHIAQEETKFGLDEEALSGIVTNAAALTHVEICGLMGMASFSTNMAQVRSEFGVLRNYFEKYRMLQMPNVHFEILSMGMSADYEIAIEEGSTLVRIGSLLFGNR